MKKQDNSSNLIAAGIVGAIVGAGAGVVAVVAMKDEKTQKYIKNLSQNFYEQMKENFRKRNVPANSPKKKTLKKLSTGKTK